MDLSYSIALHDAILLYAHAATKVLSAGGDLSDGAAVTAAVRSTSFVGVGGNVVNLDDHGDRIESYEVMNYVADDQMLISMLVSMYGATASSSAIHEYTIYEREVVWPGSTKVVPVDYLSGGICIAISRVENVVQHGLNTRSNMG